MKAKYKPISIGLLLIIVSVFFINGFIQVNMNAIVDGSTSGSNVPAPSFGNADMNYTVIYGPPTDLTVSKTESVTIDVFPNGSIKTERVTVNFLFENDGEENCTVDLIDRAEYCDLDTIKFQKGTFIELLEYQVLQDDANFGVTILKWSNITVKAHSRAEYGYSMVSYRPIPITVETEYYVNGSPAVINEEKNAFNASIGTHVSNIVRIRNIQQDYFSTSSTTKPMTLCLVTLMLPFEEDEDDRDIAEPIFNPAPITTNVIVGIQQVSWLALGEVYEINWSTTILKGGGWGIIELQPIRIDLIQSSQITGLLFDGLSGLIGLLAAQQAYWAGLTLMSMIEQLTGMVGVLQMLLNDIQVQMGMLHMLNYSLLSSLLMSLIELDMTRTSLSDMYHDLNATYYDYIFGTFPVNHPVRSTFRTLLGITEYGIYLEGLYSNGSITGVGIGAEYRSLPLTILYLEDIERRLVASFGAQFIEILGSPAVLNLTDTVANYRVFMNASVIRNPNNTTDFYTLIEIVNLTLPIDVLGIEVVALNLSRRYEFELNDVPGDRPIFEAIDNYFGHPGILEAIFPVGYTAPGSPGSNLPGFYTWMLDLVQVGQSALWWMLGNLTRSLATMMLQLDSSFSQETLDLLGSVLSGEAVDLDTPITLETGFGGVSGLMNIFSDLQDQFTSPFGNLFSEFIPDMGSFGMPVGGDEMALLDNFGFWTALKIYLSPVPRIRQLLNITIPIDFGTMTAGNDTGAMGSLGSLGSFGFAKSAENGYMADWDWNSTIVSAVTQTNIVDDIHYKRFEFQATGNENVENLTLLRSFDYTFPAFWVDYRFRVNTNAPDVSIVVVSENGLGEEVYAIEDIDLSGSGYIANSWYESKLDLRSTLYWDLYNTSFNPEVIKRVEIRIIPHITSPIAFDLDYLNFTHDILPYPYDLTLLDMYLAGDGVELLPNITIWEKWTSGLTVNALETEDFTGDGVEDVLMGSNDGYIYLLNGNSGTQIWNFSLAQGIKNIFLEDIAGDTTSEILIGTNDGEIVILNKSRQILMNFTLPLNIAYLIQANGTGNEHNHLVIGTEDNIYMVDYSGNILWNTTVKGSIREILAEDIDGDGLDEIAVITSKYKVYTLNGSSGEILWDYITEERPTHLTIGHFLDDSTKDVLYSTDDDYCVMLDGITGAHLLNFTTPSAVRGLYTANLTGDLYDDLVLYTGLIVGHNISAMHFTPTPTLLWNFTSNYSYNYIKVMDWSAAHVYDELLVASMNNRIYLFDNAGNLQLNFTTPRGVNTITTADLTQEGETEFIFGLTNNYVQAVNGSDQNQLWITEEGESIITFQFIRTNETIQLNYNLPDPITDLTDLFGPTLAGTGDLLDIANLEIPIAFDSMGGLDISSMNITLDDLPLTGIGLVNMLEFEITLIMTLQDMKQVGATQQAFTGLHEVRYTDKDTIDYQLYPLITQDIDALYYQYKLRNYEEQTIKAHYFVLNMTYEGQPLDLDRISIEGWNGTHFVDLNDNPIYNITLSQLGLNYTNGYLIFRPFIEVEELEKSLLTVDWLGRELRVKVDTIGLNLSRFFVEPWVDVSIELSGIELPGVSSIITYSKTIPTFVVSATPTPNITTDEKGRPLIEVLLSSPAFWALSTSSLVAVFGLGYMRKREEQEVEKAASKKIIKWMNKRELSWRTLVKANVMSNSQYYDLKRIRYRLKKEMKENMLEQKIQEVIKWNFIGHFIRTVLLMRFWRGINKPSRLVWILGTLEHMVLDPLKHAWSTFKTALGYLNPWDMDRQRKKELIKKAGNKQFWKKIEPPRKPIRKKRVEVFTTPISPKLKVSEELVAKKKKKKGWTGEYRNDGGIILNKLNKAKKLPPIGSRDGQVFYTLSKRKYVGMSVKELAEEIEIEEYEALVSIIRLLEKGLIFLLQEGNTVCEDLWDVTSSLRKYDSELEKMLESIESLEDEITEGMEFLSTDLNNENDSKESKQ